MEKVWAKIFTCSSCQQSCLCKRKSQAVRWRTHPDTRHLICTHTKCCFSQKHSDLCFPMAFSSTNLVLGKADSPLAFYLLSSLFQVQDVISFCSVSFWRNSLRLGLNTQNGSNSDHQKQSIDDAPFTKTQSGHVKSQICTIQDISTVQG